MILPNRFICSLVLTSAAIGCGDEQTEPERTLAEQCALEVRGGDVLLTEAEQVGALRCRTHIDGDLVLDGAAPISTLLLPQLREVSGTITLTHSAVLTSVGFERLVAVGGAIQIEANPLMTSADFPKLETANGGIAIATTPLDSLELGALRITAGLSVTQCTLTVLSLPNLGSVQGDLNLSQAGLLAAVDFPGLTEVDGAFSVEELPSITSLAYQFPLLGRVGGSFSVRGNEQLPRCEAEKLRDQVQSRNGIGGLVRIQDNDSAGVCL